MNKELDKKKDGAKNWINIYVKKCTYLEAHVGLLLQCFELEVVHNSNIVPVFNTAGADF